MASPRKKSTSRKTHPASIVAFTELDEEFFRAGEALSESGELPASCEHTLDEMYAPLPLRHRILRALDVRTWFRRRASVEVDFEPRTSKGVRTSQAIRTSQPLPTTSQPIPTLA